MYSFNLKTEMVLSYVTLLKTSSITSNKNQFVVTKITYITQVQQRSIIWLHISIISYHLLNPCNITQCHIVSRESEGHFIYIVENQKGIHVVHSL